MKRYSEYKDSGVKWIGEIPGHWNAVSLKRVVKLINENISVPLKWDELNN